MFVTLFDLMHFVLQVMRENNKDIIFSHQYFDQETPFSCTKKQTDVYSENFRLLTLKTENEFGLSDRISYF